MPLIFHASNFDRDLYAQGRQDYRAKQAQERRFDYLDRKDREEQEREAANVAAYTEGLQGLHGAQQIGQTGLQAPNAPWRTNPADALESAIGQVLQDAQASGAGLEVIQSLQAQAGALREEFELGQTRQKLGTRMEAIMAADPEAGQALASSGLLEALQDPAVDPRLVRSEVAKALGQVEDSRQQRNQAIAQVAYIDETMAQLANPALKSLYPDEMDPDTGEMVPNRALQRIMADLTMKKIELGLRGVGPGGGPAAAPRGMPVVQPAPQPVQAQGDPAQDAAASNRFIREAREREQTAATNAAAAAQRAAEAEFGKPRTLEQVRGSELGAVADDLGKAMQGVQTPEDARAALVEIAKKYRLGTVGANGQVIPDAGLVELAEAAMLGLDPREAVQWTGEEDRAARKKTAEIMGQPTARPKRMPVPVPQADVQATDLSEEEQSRLRAFLSRP